MSLEEAKDCSIDKESYPDFFPVNIGEGFHLETMPSLLSEIPNPRQVRIEITSFVGVSCGACHYYAQLIADGVKMYDKAICNGKVVKRYHYGYLGEEYKQLIKDHAEYDKFYKIEVCRKLTQKEIDDNPERWEFYDAGSNTNAFYSKDDAIAQAKAIVSARFAEGWEVLIDDLT